MKFPKVLWTCLLLICGGVNAAVNVSGDVRNPGPVELQPGGRVLDVMRLAQPNPESYWLAAACCDNHCLRSRPDSRPGSCLT